MVVGIPIPPDSRHLKVAKTHVLASAINQIEPPKYSDINFSPKPKIAIILVLKILVVVVSAGYPPNYHHLPCRILP